MADSSIDEDLFADNNNAPNDMLQGFDQDKLDLPGAGYPSVVIEQPPSYVTKDGDFE